MMKSVTLTFVTDREDLRSGYRVELGSYTLSKEEIVTFASQWDPQFFHLDERRAANKGYFGGLIASGVQTLAVYQRLTVGSLFRHWDVIGGAGIRDLKFLHPVRPGDTLTGFTVIEDVQGQSERGRIQVALTGGLVNQSRRQVLALTMLIYLRMPSL